MALTCALTSRSMRAMFAGQALGDVLLSVRPGGGAGRAPSQWARAIAVDGFLQESFESGGSSGDSGGIQTRSSKSRARARPTKSPPASG